MNCYYLLNKNNTLIWNLWFIEVLKSFSFFQFGKKLIQKAADKSGDFLDSRNEMLTHDFMLDLRLFYPLTQRIFIG